MPRHNQAAPASPGGRTSLHELRLRAGYRNAKDLAVALGVPNSTYSRWEKGSDGPVSAIPMQSAWAIADKLGTSIDAVVGRAPAGPLDEEPEPRDLNGMARAMSAPDRHALEQFADFLALRESVIAREREAAGAGEVA